MRQFVTVVLKLFRHVHVYFGIPFLHLSDEVRRMNRITFRIDILIVAVMMNACAVEQSGHEAMLAQPTDGQWLVGQWEGKISPYAGKEGAGRTLRVAAVFPDGTMQATWAVTGDTPGDAEVQVDGWRVRVVTGANSVVVLNRTSNGSLTGTFTLQNGRIFWISLTKILAAGDIPSFVPTFAALRQAIARGQVKEFVTAMETIGSEAEGKQRWAAASDAYYNASLAAMQSGQLQKAIAYGTKAVELGQRAKSPYRQANPSQILGNAYQRLRQFDKQRDWLQRGLEVSKQMTNGIPKEELQARLNQGLGNYYLEQGEVQNAIEHLSNSVQKIESQLSYFKSTRANSRTIQTREAQLTIGLNQLGNAYLRAGKSQDAINVFEQGLAIIKESKVDSFTEAGLISGLGAAYLAQKDYARAMEQFTAALQLAESRKQGGLIENASSRIGNLLLQTQREAEAIPYFKKAIDAIESTRSELGSEEFRTSFFENKGATYGGMIRAQLASTNVGAAFDHNERARSRAFLDILGDKLKLSKQAALVDEEQRLQARIAALKTPEDEHQEGDNDVEELTPAQRQKELEAAEKAYADFLAKVRKENKEQASLMNVEPLTLKEVQDRLDFGVTLLEYFITNNSVIVWIVDKGAVNSVSVPLQRKELQAKVTAFRESISQLEELAKLNQQAQELFKSLIQPALPHIKGKELLIIPHDVLHYLPFQALLSPSGKYLIEDYPINYLSSASLMQFTQEKRNARGELRKVLADGGKVLTFGNPDLGDPKMALQFAGIEAKEIKSLYPQSAIYLEKEATEENAKALVGSSDIIHFASHAELNEDDPLASAIRLAKSDKEDGRLEVREIFGMDLKASLVVLSACETGLGKLSSGDELVGLTRAFIYAGTPSVVASLWNVEDSSTAQLMASFYKNLKTMTKVEALRQAQLNLIRGNINSDLLARRGIGGIGKLGEVPNSKSLFPDSISVSAPVSVSTSHPFFWAPFILVGEGK
jgi:CHAT domain-containing protein/Tfp pilus assembly protein PilF